MSSEEGLGSAGRAITNFRLWLPFPFPFLDDDNAIPLEYILNSNKNIAKKKEKKTGTERERERRRGTGRKILRKMLGKIFRRISALNSKTWILWECCQRSKRTRSFKR